MSHIGTCKRKEISMTTIQSLTRFVIQRMKTPYRIISLGLAGPDNYILIWFSSLNFVKKKKITKSDLRHKWHDICDGLDVQHKWHQICIKTLWLLEHLHGIWNLSLIQALIVLGCYPLQSLHPYQTHQIFISFILHFMIYNCDKFPKADIKRKHLFGRSEY